MGRRKGRRTVWFDVVWDSCKNAKSLCCFDSEQKVTSFFGGYHVDISVFIAPFMENMDCEVAIQETSPELK